MTSWRRWRKCFSPEMIRAGSSKKSEKMATTPRFLNRSARSWSTAPRSDFSRAGVTSRTWISSFKCDGWLAGFKYRRTASSKSPRPTESCCWMTRYARAATTNCAYFSLLTFWPGGVGHRLARVQQQIEQEVGLLLVLLEVKLVGLGPDLPVHVADVVAGHVLAVLGELDGEAVIRAGVHARHVAFDDQPGLEIQPFEASQRSRI